MSESTTANHSAGLSFFSILGLIFITLKLTGHIDWSWVWVLAPIWGPVAFVLTIVLLVLLFAGLVAGFTIVGNKYHDWRRKRSK